MGIEREFAEENFIRSTKCVNHARVLAREVAPQIQVHFPELFPRVPYVAAIHDQGWLNSTLLVGVDRTSPEYVLRLAAIASPRQLNPSRSALHFEKERYVLDALKGLALVPEVPERGTGRFTITIPGRGEVQYAYILQSRIPFSSAKGITTAAERRHCLWQLGECLRLIQGPVVQGYGNDFDETRQRFKFESFADSISAHVATIEQSPVHSSMKRWLNARVASLIALQPEARLCHRDLLGNFGNFLVDAQGNVRGVIDWEFAGAGLALHAELASFVYVLTRDGASPGDIELDLAAVLGGFGISMRDYRAHYERDVETLVLIHSLMALIKYDLVQKSGAVEREPWRKVFAERADALCSGCYSRDLPRRGRSSRGTELG
jgi:aminoglycoside phosphotransferase (APT) family kinase protein